MATATVLAQMWNISITAEILLDSAALQILNTHAYLPGFPCHYSAYNVPLPSTYANSGHSGPDVSCLYNLLLYYLVRVLIMLLHLIFHFYVSSNYWASELINIQGINEAHTYYNTAAKLSNKGPFTIPPSLKRYASFQSKQAKDRAFS